MAKKHTKKREIHALPKKKVVFNKVKIVAINSYYNEKFSLHTIATKSVAKGYCNKKLCYNNISFLEKKTHTRKGIASTTRKKRYVAIKSNFLQ